MYVFTFRKSNSCKSNLNLNYHSSETCPNLWLCGCLLWLTHPCPSGHTLGWSPTKWWYLVPQLTVQHSSCKAAETEAQTVDMLQKCPGLTCEHMKITCLSYKFSQIAFRNFPNLKNLWNPNKYKTGNFEFTAVRRSNLPHSTTRFSSCCYATVSKQRWCAPSTGLIWHCR